MNDLAVLIDYISKDRGQKQVVIIKTTSHVGTRNRGIISGLRQSVVCTSTNAKGRDSNSTTGVRGGNDLAVSIDYASKVLARLVFVSTNGHFKRISGTSNKGVGFGVDGNGVSIGRNPTGNDDRTSGANRLKFNIKRVNSRGLQGIDLITNLDVLTVNGTTTSGKGKATSAQSGIKARGASATIQIIRVGMRNARHTNKLVAIGDLNPPVTRFNVVVFGHSGHFYGPFC